MNIPIYIKNELDKHDNIKLLHLTNDQHNPSLFYQCLDCNSEQMCTFEDLKSNNIHKNHDKPNYYKVLERFLEGKVEYTKGEETLSVINPITKQKIHFCYEIPKYRIIIELIGQQDKEYIEYFHGNERNFKFQRYRHQVKKDYAEEHGYHLIYLSYDDILNGDYKEYIANKVNERHKIKFEFIEELTSSHS